VAPRSSKSGAIAPTVMTGAGAAAGAGCVVCCAVADDAATETAIVAIAADQRCVSRDMSLPVKFNRMMHGRRAARKSTSARRLRR